MGFSVPVNTISGERQSLAMLSGDVEGYSRLMATDEEATIRTLTSHRDAIGVAIVSNHGRLVDFTGDNFLAEFGVATHALRCAIEIQDAVAAENAALPNDRHMKFRLGAHIGEVRIEGERIYGNAVNVASRLEGLSEAGGICLSQELADAVADHIALDLRDLGAQIFKNIPHPVRALAVDASVLEVERSRARKEMGVAPVGGIPSIAVLPFASLSSEREQESLADAMTVDIITGLSCDRRFSVIAYNSVLHFKGDKVPDVRDLSRMLGARYVVEGSVRHIGPRLRVSAALIDAATRRELWGGRVDRDMGEAFEAFDDMVEGLVTALASHLKMAEGQRYRRRPPEQLDAWALAIQASEIFFLNPTKTLDESFVLARRALESDPEYPYAWAVLGFLTAFKFPLGLSEDHQADVDESLRLTDRALAMDARDPWILVARAVALQYGGRPAESMQYLQRSLRMNPSDVLAHCYYGRGLMFSGKPATAIAHFERFNRLNPNDPGAHMAAMYHSLAFMFLERWAEAEPVARESLAASGGRNPWAWVILAVALGGQDRVDDASNALCELGRVAPHWDLAFVKGFLDDCQENKALLLPTASILNRIWPAAQSPAD